MENEPVSPENLKTGFEGFENPVKEVVEEYEEDEEEKEISSRLSPELIARAEIEVNEKDAWRMRDIEALRDMVQGEPSLTSRLDNTFLLRFLRARRFDYDGAFQLLCDYYRLPQSHPELFTDLDRLSPLFESNAMCLSPGRSVADETVFILRMGRWNPRVVSFDQVIAAAIRCMEMASFNDEVAQINGFVAAIDMTGFGWAQLRKFGPSQAKQVIHLIDHCLPIRLKHIYVIKESYLADIGFAIIRPFMSEELHEKIVFCGTQLSILHSSVPPEVLPEEFGGKLGPLTSGECFKQLKGFETDWRRNFDEHGFTEPEAGGSTGSGPSSAGGVCRRDLASGTDMKSLFRKSQTCNGYLFDYYNTSTSVD